MKIRLGVRTRLTIVYGGLLFAALALAGTGVVILLRQRLLQRLDTALNQQLVSLEVFVRREIRSTTSTRRMAHELAEYVSTQPKGSLITVIDDTGKALIGGGSISFPVRSQTRDFTLYGHIYKTQSAAPLRPIEEFVQEIVFLLVWSLPLLLVLIATMGYWITGRALRLVDEMTAAARSMGSGTLDKRLAIPPTRDELSRLAEAWNEMLDRIKESFDRMQRFTADAAHELRTPLTGLRSSAELALRRQRSSEEYREALAQVLVISERMHELNEGLLALARGDNRPLPPPGYVNVSSVVEEVVGEMSPLLHQKNLSIALALPEGAPLHQADTTGLRRLFAVLVDNARKYTQAGGKIVVSVVDNPLYIEIRVADTGCGIPEDAIPRIFDRFYRVDASRDRETGGYGLGLSIAQQIVASHCGHIDVSSVVGVGTTFSVHLPK